MKFAVLALLAVLGQRNEKAAGQLAAAKEAYQQALAKTGDFDCAAPEFDAVLKLFDAVPRATPSRKEAKDLAKQIREKRAAAARHKGALDAVRTPDAMAARMPSESAAAPAPEDAAPRATDPETCKLAKKKMIVFAVARKKAGRPPLGQTTFLASGEVGFVPGAEPSAEEAALMQTLRGCP